MASTSNHLWCHRSGTRNRPNLAACEKVSLFTLSNYSSNLAPLWKWVSLWFEGLSRFDLLSKGESFPMTRVQTRLLCEKVSLFALNYYSLKVAPYEKVSLFASNDHSSNFACCEKVYLFFSLQITTKPNMALLWKGSFFFKWLQSQTRLLHKLVTLFVSNEYKVKHAPL